MATSKVTGNSAAWQGDWNTRIRSRLQQWGYEGLLDYLKTSPGTSFVSLAEDLGPDVVGAQIIPLALQEARSKGQLRWLAMDFLVRHIRDVFQNGWGRVYIPPSSVYLTEEGKKELATKGEENRISFQKAHALGGFVADVSDPDSMPRVTDLAEAIGTVFDELAPPVGWLPADADDPIVQEAFARVWPPGREQNFTPERVSERLCEKGYSSLLDYLEDRQAIPYQELVKEIGPDSIAVGFLRWLHCREAHRAGQIRRAAMDCLAREIAQVGGWPGVKVFTQPSEPVTSMNVDPEDAKKLQWKAEVIFRNWALDALLPYGDNITQHAEPVWEALEELDPPRGWIPSGADDPLIVAAFDEGWRQGVRSRKSSDCGQHAVNRPIGRSIGTGQ